MKALLFIYLFLFTSFVGIGQAQVSRDLEAFSHVRASGNLTVTLKKGETNSVIIYTNKALTPSDVVTKVKGGVLKVSLRTKIYKNAEVKVALTYKGVESLHAGSAAKIKSSDILEVSSLELNAVSAGKLYLPLQVTNLEVSASTGGELQLSGTAEKLEATSSSGGSMDAYELNVNRAYVKANTGGVVEVLVKNYLEAKAATGGAVYYQGNPKELVIKENLGGKVVKR